MATKRNSTERVQSQQQAPAGMPREPAQMNPDASAAGINDPEVQAAIQRGAMRRAQADMAAGRRPGSTPMTPPATEGRMQQPVTGGPAADQQPIQHTDERVGGIVNDTSSGDPMSTQPMAARRMTEERIRKARMIMDRYKRGKASVDRRVQESQKWWKGKNWEVIQEKTDVKGVEEFHRNTRWLWNSIAGKHADAMDSYPEPIIMPRAEDDKQEAENLTDIIPVVLSQNRFEETYSDCQWQKLIEGTAVYSVIWDSHKFHGLGDISVNKITLLNLFWEPGINDIQESSNVFHVAMVDNELLYDMYPQTKGHLGKNADPINKYPTDDNVDDEDKSLVVDWYYHRYDPEQDRQVLHFCKFVNSIILYATEDDQGDPMDPAGGSPARDGLYDHGMYPFVLDPLYPVEGSPCGYGYVDIGKDIQMDIDIISEACVQNADICSRTRYLVRQDSGINEQELMDTRNPIVHFSGTLDPNSFQQIPVNTVPGNCVELMQQKIEELKFITGNSDVNNGATPSGVTAAAAIQALKEDSGRTSKDSNRAAFRAYKQLVTMVIELIRQFYNQQRIFRIKGPNGEMQFVPYSNAGLVPQDQGMDFGIDMGVRVPEFDIDVHVQREDAYTRLSQNELAIQLYQLGVFNPQMAPMVVQMLDMMDFKGKEELVQKIQQNGDLANMLSQVLQIAVQLAGQAGDPSAQAQLMAIAQQLGMPIQAPAAQGGPAMEDARHETDPSNGDGKANLQTRQDTILQKASERAQSATRPE